MSEQSPVLSMPYIQPAQAQKHVTHNEALRLLDAVTQLSVISADLDAPPSQVSEGERYIVAAGATGDWAGQDQKVAVRTDSAWHFFEPNLGWRADVAGTGATLRFDGLVWGTNNDAVSLQNLPSVGIGTTADTTNRLSVSSEATLLNNAGAGHQLKLNKAAQSDTSSLLFQTGFSGRAEMGTVGSDDFEVKVSPDGSTFHSALKIDADQGAVQFPSAQNFFQDVFILNDTAWSFPIPWSNPSRIMMWMSVNIQARFYLIAITGSISGANNFAEMFASPPGTLSFLSGALSGTTGPSGGINLSIDANGGSPMMYVENRLGSNRLFTMSTLGK